MATTILDEQQTTESTDYTEEAARTRRTRGEDAVPARGHSAVNVPDDFRSINGWGADLDPANRPAVPREWPSDVMTLRGDVKHWQEPRFKIHISNEQPNLTPVFGESCPPRGLNAKVRDWAYEYGEGRNRHWMLLLLADRMDNIGSLLGGVLRLRPDNIPAEKAWGTLWHYSSPDRRREIALGVTTGLLAAACVVAWIVAD